MANHRNRKLLDLAHEVKECQIQLPGICEGFAVDGCEPVHSDRQMHGKGMGLKAHDCYHAAGCHSCHMAIHGNELSRGEKQEAWRRGYERTQLYYWQMGWVKVA